MKLLARNVLITGGSQGLGKVIAGHFIKAGANVALCARDPLLLEETRTELALAASPGQRVLAMPCDISSEEQVAAFVQHASAALGEIHVLITNAGVYGPLGPTESVDFNEWKRAIEINLYGVLLPCRAVFSHFKKACAGKIIMISGGGATNPLPNISSYAASKAALVRLMETLSEEWKSYCIDVNAVAPGALKTRLMHEVLDAGPEKVGETFYAKNVKWMEGAAASPDLCASLCVYLASPRSNGITGRLISAQWDRWDALHLHKEQFGDIYTLRRIIPEDRGQKWD